MSRKSIRVSRGEADRFFRLEYLVPLVVYLSFGASALSSVVGTFIVKEHLTLSATDLARAWFWATIPWILKIPLAVCVDRFWRWQGTILSFGALLVVAGILLTFGIVAAPDELKSFCSLESAYVVSLVLGSCGYVLQDVVADALTVEAVPRVETSGQPRDTDRILSEQLWLQTLGRGAGLCGMLFVGALQWWVFSSPAFESSLQGYRWVLGLSLLFPLSTAIVSVFASVVARSPRGESQPSAQRPRTELLALGGVYAAIAIGLGASGVRYGEELLFVISAVVTGMILSRLAKDLAIGARQLFFVAIVVFVVTGLTPQLGEGVRWWQIDDLHLGQRFFTVLSVMTSVAALIGIAVGARFVRGRSPIAVAWWCTVLSAASTSLLLVLAFRVSWGTATLFEGVTLGELATFAGSILNAPLTQLATLPAMAAVAAVASPREKATYIAVIATVANVAGGGSRLLAGYLNSVWTVERGAYEHVPALIIATIITSLLLVGVGYFGARLYQQRATSQ